MKRLLALLLLSTLLISCGAGGGEDTTTSPGIELEYIGTIDSIDKVDIYRFHHSIYVCYVSVTLHGTGISCN